MLASSASALDLRPAVLGGEELPLADQQLGRGVEAVVLEADEGAAEKREPVQHHAPAEHGARLAREALVAADLELVVGAAEGAAEPRAPAGALQDGQVEVAHVPAGQHVGVDAPHVGEEALEERALVGHRLGARDLAPRDHEDALAARARQGERVEPLAVEARLDVEREHAEPGRELRRRERGVPVDAPHARAALEVARDREGPADAVVDQVAVREAEVGLEAVDARLAEAVAHPGHVAGERHLDAHDGLAAEGAERARHEAHGGGEPAHLGLVGGAYEKVRREPVIDDQRRLAVLEHRVEMHLGSPGGDPVGGRQDEAALGHVLILPVPLGAY